MTDSTLADRWADYLRRRTEIQAMAEQANAGTVSYAEYDVARADLNETGAELADTMAGLLGLT